MRRRLVPPEDIKKLARFHAYITIARHNRSYIKIREHHAIERVPAFIPRISTDTASPVGGINRTECHRQYVKIHTGMKWRCKHHPDYQGRGITYAPEWEKYEDFERDIDAHLGTRPSEDCTLDRIDNDGPYQLENVRWATKKEQAINRRKRRQGTSLALEFDQGSKQ